MAVEITEDESAAVREHDHREFGLGALGAIDTQRQDSARAVDGEVVHLAHGREMLQRRAPATDDVAQLRRWNRRDVGKSGVQGFQHGRNFRVQ